MKKLVPYSFLLFVQLLFPQVAYLQDIEITLQLPEGMDLFPHTTGYEFAANQPVNLFETFQVNTISATSMVCNTNGDCNDGIDCTTDICNAGTCQNTPVNAVCSDGEFCNGEEICSPTLGCFQVNMSPCTECQTCNEGLAQCDNLPNGTSCSGGSTCQNGVCQALPVELVDFLSRITQEGTQLSWRTASETQNAHFLIQHSTDGRTFHDLAQIPGNGNSYQENNYEYLHENPSPGTNYYRLKQVDFDGNYEYSFIRSIVVEADSKQAMFVFPNPATEQVDIHLPGMEYGSLLSISGHTGNIVWLQHLDGTEDNIRIDLGNRGFENGIYIISIIAGGKNWTRRLVLAR